MMFPSRAAREVHEWQKSRRRRWRWLLWWLPVMIALTASPASAHAHHRHHHPAHHAARKHYSPISAAYTIAARYWGVQPCNGDITWRFGPPPANMVVPAYTVAGMWASWDPGTPYENDETAPQPFFGCVIGINPEVWPTEYFMAFTAWPEFSVQWIHEFGHFLGVGHSSDQASVMFFGQLSVKPQVTGEYAPGWERN